MTQLERQLILWDLLSRYEVLEFTQIEAALPLVKKRTLQRDVRDLTDAGLVSVKYSGKEEAYKRKGESSDEISEYAREHYSNRKLKHFTRLRRLVQCQRMGEEPDMKAAYFRDFPECTERMRLRDFEVLKRVGTEIEYCRYDGTYSVDGSSMGDEYDVRIKNGKMYV
jgi:DNA-binding transcriptional ArsR family regulator